MIEIIKLPIEKRKLMVAIWTAEMIDQYKPLKFPKMPKQMIDYYNADRIRRSKISDEFWKQPEIKMYIKLKNKVYVHNMSCLHHLNDCLSILNDENHIDLNVIKDALSLFDETKNYHNNRIKEILEDENQIEPEFVNSEPEPISVDDIEWDDDEPKKEKRRADLED